MLDALPPWGHALPSIRPLADGEHELTFVRASARLACEPLYHGITGAKASLSPSAATLAKKMVDARKCTMNAMESGRMLCM